MPSRSAGGRLTIALITMLCGAGLCMIAQPAWAQATTKRVYTFFQNAIAKRDNLPPANLGAWHFIGPINFSTGLITAFGEDPSSGSGDDVPVSGRVNGIAVSPSDPNIIYIAAPSGGIWKSIDRGRTWNALSDSWPFQSVTAVAVDPSNPDRVYAGTGDYHRWDHVPPFGFGIFRSVNGGRSWLSSGANQFGDQPVSRIVVDPFNPAIITATTGHGGNNRRGGIWRSTDFGQSWSAATPAVIAHHAPIAIPAANWDDLEVCLDGTYWASASQANPRGGAGDAGGLLFRSLDHGETWLPATIPSLSVPGTVPARTIDFSTSTAQAVHVGCSRNQLGVVYVATIGTSPQTLGLLKTNDNGSHWKALPLPRDDALKCHSTLNLCYPWAHSHLTIGTLGNEDVIYLGLVDLFRLQHGKWDVINKNASGKNLIHNDQSTAALDPGSSDTVYVATDGGLYRWQNRTGRFTSLNSQLGISQVFRMDIHPVDRRRISVGTQDNGDAISLGRVHPGSTWAMVLGGDGRSVPFDQSHRDIGFLVNTAGTLARYNWNVPGPSRAGRQAFSYRPAPGQNPMVFADHLYAATSGLAVLKYGDDPSSAPTAFLLPVHISSPSITALAVCGNGSVIYAGLDDGRLFRTLPGGGWRNISGSSMPKVPIRSIDARNGHCKDAIVGFGYDTEAIHNDSISHGPFLFHTLNSAEVPVNWEAIPTGAANQIPLVPINTVLRSPLDPSGNTWFAATEVGVFQTRDAGHTWTNAGSPHGLPNTFVRDLQIGVYQDGTFIYAATFGRGIWRAQLPVRIRPPFPPPPNACELSCKADRDSCMSGISQGNGRPLQCVVVFNACMARCH